MTAQDAPQGGLEFALNGGEAGLHLPSVVGGAIVGEGKFPVLHRRLDWLGSA